MKNIIQLTDVSTFLGPTMVMVNINHIVFYSKSDTIENANSIVTLSTPVRSYEQGDKVSYDIYVTETFEQITKGILLAQ